MESQQLILNILLLTSVISAFDVELNQVPSDGIKVRKWICGKDEKDCTPEGIIVGEDELGEGAWSKWYDDDWPTKTGDYERIVQLREHKHFRCDKAPQCENFAALRVELTAGENPLAPGDTIMSIDNKVHVDFFTPETKESAGFYCLNKENPKGCANYKVKFFCKKEAIKCEKKRELDDSVDVAKKEYSLLKLLLNLSKAKENSDVIA